MADVVDKQFIFKPFESIGLFQFDTPIDYYQDILSAFIFEPKDEFGKEYYKSQDGRFILAVRNHQLESIFCYHELWFREQNLIGLTIAEFEHLLQTHHTDAVEELDFEEDGYPQRVYSFDDVGAQVWEKQGRIVTIIASGRASFSDQPFEE